MAEKRKEMVFANRVERNFAHDYRVMAFLFEYGVNGLSGVYSHTGEKLQIHPGYALGSILKTFPVRVFPDSLQDVFDCLFYATMLDG
jgi:hypothetical protein